MNLSPATKKQRHGAMVVLVAILLIPLLAMVAFAVDIAWIVTTRTQLQNAADSAALAGAEPLMQGYVLYYLPGQTQQSTILSNTLTSARTAARNYASYNSAGGVSSLTLNDNDIEFGYTDSSNNYTPMSSSTTFFPNTIKVLLRRDSTANGSLKLFFGPVLGTNTTDVKATAAATIYTGTVDSFTNPMNQNVFVLPMTYDVNHWNSFLQTGQGPDGTTDNGANGAPQLQVYPSIKFVGDFGLLSLDQSNDGASAISSWINNGVSSSDLQNEYNAGLLPLSSHPPLTWDWKGDSGLRTSDIQTLQGEIGNTYLLPLFNPVNNGSIDPTLYAAGVRQGTNYLYDIVQFVAITITYVDNFGVHVQPSAMVVPNGIFTNVTPAATPTATSPLITTFTAPKLSQ
jgi:Flp pilus assembly protein TadG